MDSIGPISKEEFERLPAKARDVIMYSYILELHETVRRLERRKLFDKAIALVSGAGAGAVVMLGKIAFWK